MAFKNRKDKAPSEKNIEAFAAGADKPAGSLNPKAARNYKYLKLSFNEYEYTRLKSACESADRGLLDFIRKAIKDATEKELD